MTTEKAARAATASQTSETPVTLMEISVDGVADPLRFAFNDENITHQDETYLASGFQYKPPAQGTEDRTVGQLRVDNVDRSMSQAVKDQSKEPKIDLFEIMASEPDIVTGRSPTFTLFNIGWDFFTMEGTLGLPDDSDEPAQAATYGPKDAPALYAI